MRISATQYVERGFPTTEGRNLAQGLLADHSGKFESLVIDVSSVPGTLIISAFFNAFLQRIHELAPEELPSARRVVWEPRFGFQKDAIAEWVEHFKPVGSRGRSA